MSAVGEAMGEMISAILNILDRGLPISIALAEEAGGYRMTIPGSSNLVDQVNAILAEQMPLLQAEGGDTLRMRKDFTNEGSSGRVTLELQAAPGWQEVAITASLDATNPQGKPRTVKLVLTGSVAPGLYPAGAYEADIMGLIGSAMPQ